jgi:arabinogalactan endo-1,4-beta-galactosidase
LGVKRASAAVFLIGLVAASSGNDGVKDSGKPAAQVGDVRAAGFIKGADISFLQEIEDRGGVFREDGNARDPLDILKEHGFNYARLRIWHTPPAGYCSLDSTLVMAARIKAKGLGLLLDFHYSDTWADPGRQSKPEAWQGLTFDTLRDSLYRYTRLVIKRLKSRNALPDIVEIGNEITCGMLWDDGRVCGAFDRPEQWARLASLISAGIAGVEAALGPDDLVSTAIHLDRGADIAGVIWFFDNLPLEAVDFDVIALSYYPWWHGTLDRVEATLDSVARRYEKDVIIVETAYPWTLAWCDDTPNIVGREEQLHTAYPATVDGQSAFLRDLIDIVAVVPASRGRGVFYWAPEYISVPGMGSPWENLTLFDFDGNVLPSVDVFDREVPVDSGDALPGE